MIVEFATMDCHSEIYYTITATKRNQKMKMLPLALRFLYNLPITP